MGTRGDVQPYIYLARALNARGHETFLGSHPCWKKLVEHSNVNFVPIGPDIDIELETSRIRGKSNNVALSMLKTMNFVFQIIEKSTNEVSRACEGMDQIIVTHSQMGAAEAEALNIPTVNVTLQTEMIPQKLKKTSFGDKLFGMFIGPQIVKPYNKIRKVYGLPKLKSSGELISGKINLIPISEYVKKRNPYWEDKNIFTGYWYEENTYIPSQELQDFLDRGEKPIILALGAMSFEAQSEKDKLDLFVNAFQKTNTRVIIQGFQKTIQEYNLPDTMIAVGSIPHSWLFRQGYAVIHHCGFGTSSAAMIYGIPSIPIPHILDQVGFAMQMEEIGVSTHLLKIKDLSEAKIIEAIHELEQQYTSIYENVQTLSKKLQAERGLDHAIRLIETAIID